MPKLERNLNALVIIIISAILLGAYAFQFIKHEQPCPLCMMQRLGMIAAASSLLLNVWFGIRMGHYALALLSSLVGASVAVRQIILHLCPTFPPGNVPIFGLNLFTWSFLTFVGIIIVVSLLLFLYDPETQKRQAPINGLGKLAAFLILFVAVANIVTTFVQCGFGACN